MKEATKVWSGKERVTELDIRMLDALLTGQYLKGSVPEKRRANLPTPCPERIMRKLEAMGIIVGYIPVLSERGSNIYKAMKDMFAVQNGKDELEVLMQEVKR